MIGHHASRIVYVLFPMLMLAQSVPEFDAERAFGFLEGQCALGARSPGTEGHEQGLKYIVDITSQLADTVVLQSFPYADPYSGAMWELTNVIAQFNPGLESRVWLAAHWDSRPWADRDQDPDLRDQPVLGANDGASGVSVLLELAHHFAENSPPQGVDLVFLDGEDLGKRGDLDHFFNGSRYLAQHLPTKPPEYCILLDMIGDKELSIPVERNSLMQAPELVNELWDLAERLGLTAFQSNLGPAVEDDHVVLFEVGGIPAIDIIDFEYPNRYVSYWHTSEDTADKCSPESLRTVGTLLLHHVYGRD